MVRRFFAILLFTACAAAFSPVRAQTLAYHFIPAAAHTPVPLFSFKDAFGKTTDLRDFKGHFILLNLWATWCSPCVREMPALDSMMGMIGGKISVIALTEDHDGLGAAQGFYKRHKLNHLPVYVDTEGEAPYILQARGLPTTLFIDPNGMEIGRFEGEADWDERETISFLEKQMDRFTEAQPKPATK